MKKFKLIIALLGFISLTGCRLTQTEKEKTIEIVQSKVMDNLFLIKNISKRDSLLKKELIQFLIKNPPKKEVNTVVSFYKYTEYNDASGMRNGTSHFIENLPDSGGFSSEELNNYQEDEIAAFTMSKCEYDTTKLVGRFYFYKNAYTREIDTLFYKCK